MFPRRYRISVIFRLSASNIWCLSVALNHPPTNFMKRYAQKTSGCATGKKEKKEGGGVGSGVDNITNNVSQYVSSV